jgi:hypothetical protein
MASDAFLVLLLLGAVVGVAWQVEGRRRLLFPLLMLYAALAYGVILTFVDSVAPFASGGDDRAYFLASQVRLHGSGWWNFNQFRSFAQGGYPLMLAWVYQLTGASTYVYKLVNLFFFLLLAVLWFRIGSEVGGRRSAWAFSLAILLATPLWMYWMFIYKEMTIVLIQSLYLLGAVRMAIGRGGVKTWVPVIAGTVLLIPLRVYLVLLNAAVTLATVVLAGRQSARRKAALLLGSGALVAGLVFLGGNERALTAFGAGGEDRTLDYETVRGVSEKYVEKRSKFSGPVGAVVFPLAYVFGETSGLQLGGGARGTTGVGAHPNVVVSGLAALPWIFFGSPLLGYALWRIFRLRILSLLRAPMGPVRMHVPPPPPRPALAVAGPPGARMQAQSGFGGGMALETFALPYAPAAARAPARRAATKVEAEERGWLPLLLFLLFYAVVAWVVEDTTRWRMPAFPVMAALAAQGWIWLGPRYRTVVVGGWATAMAVLFTLYYGILK